MKTVLAIVTFVAALSGVGWWLWKDAAPLVSLALVSKGNVKHSSPGRVEVLPQQAQQLRSLRNGIVRQVIVPPNSASRPVAEGDVIIQLDTEDVELLLQDIRVSLRAAEARLNAESDIALQVLSESRDLEDYRKLAGEGRFPKADLRKKEDALQRLKAKLVLEKIALEEEVASYRAKEAQTLRHLGELTIRSPFTGILTQVFVSNGEHVLAGKPLGILQSNERLVKVALNEEDYQGVEVGQSAAVNFLSHGSKVFHGSVSRLSDILDPSTNRRYLFLELEGGNDRFAAGSSGEAEIIKASKKDVTLIPRRALVGDAVCVWKNDLIEVREVQIGHRNLLTVEIVSGLTPGERVVVETPHLYRDGQRARRSDSSK